MATLDAQELACPLSAPLYETLRSFVTGYPWWVESTNDRSVTLCTPLPGSTNHHPAWLLVRIGVDPLGRVEQWSVWEKRRQRIGERRGPLEGYLREIGALPASEDRPGGGS